MKSVEIRSETPQDVNAIWELHAQAFGQPDEANLVDALRNGDFSVISLVAEFQEKIVGHVFFSRIEVQTDEKQIPVLSLAPVAVLSEFQRQGIGTQLIQHGIEVAKTLNEQLIFVLGEPNYYQRFGFSASEAKKFECVYACEAFQSLWLMDVPKELHFGRVVYSAPFDGL